MSTPLHPLVVHFPIALLLVAVVFQFLALWKKSLFQNAALLLFGIGWVSGLVAYLTGDPAEEYAQERWGSGLRTIIHNHEDLAFQTLVVFAIVIGLLLLNRYKPAKWIIPVVLVLSLVGGGLVAYTGHIGGQIVYDTNNVKQTDPVRPMNAEGDDD